jgi:hypothetical protein
MRRQPTVDELFIADDPAAWRAAGFSVEGGLCEVGSVRLRLEGPGRGRGIVAWSMRDAGSLELDGLPTTASDDPPPAGARHPNGVVSIDHLVVITPNLDRTTAVLREAGFDLRRLREGPTPGGSPDPRTRGEAFFRMGELILELVAAPEGTGIAADPDGPARLWASRSSSTSSSGPPPLSATCSASRARRSSPGGASPPCTRRPASAPPSRS